MNINYKKFSIKNTAILLFALFVLGIAGECLALSDAELNVIRNGFEARRNQGLLSQVDTPYPQAGDGSNVQIYSWSKLGYALAALYLNVETSEANQAIIDTKNNAFVYDDDFRGEFGLHWFGGHLCRLYEFFGQNSSHYPGRLSQAAEEAILEMMWSWVNDNEFGGSLIANADISKVLQYSGSENHRTMQQITYWAAAKMFTENPTYAAYTYADGSTPQQQYDAWTNYHIECLKELFRRGWLAEISSVGYSFYTIQGWYNFYDFSENTELRSAAGRALDFWWADWAQESINAVRAGGKARTNSPNVQSVNGSTGVVSWYYFNIGWPANKHPKIIMAIMSEYRLPLVVMDIALDHLGRGSYELASRRLGLRNSQTGFLDTDCGGIVKYSYCTPDFIMGTLMFEHRPISDWTDISAQSRHHSLIFAGNRESRIVPYVEPLSGSRHRNAWWSVQDKGTLITQKLSTSAEAGAKKIFFSDDLTTTQQSGWIFARSDPNGFAAVKVVQGTYSWESHDYGDVAVCSDEWTPVIIEAARAGDYNNNFTTFRNAVIANDNSSISGGNLTYTGLSSGAVFTFNVGGTNSPLINGSTIDYCPQFTYSGPFVNMDYGSDILTIAKDERELVIDLNNIAEYAGDITGDKKVDLSDFSVMADSWLECTDPAAEDCTDVHR